MYNKYSITVVLGFDRQLLKKKKKKNQTKNVGPAHSPGRSP
jgi:hypothetical protein